MAHKLTATKIDRYTPAKAPLTVMGSIKIPSGTDRCDIADSDICVHGRDKVDFI